MKMIRLQHDDSSSPRKGTWHHTNSHYVALLRCPDCGMPMAISQRQLTGSVVERIRCPSFLCNFKGNVELENWQEKPAQKEN